MKPIRIPLDMIDRQALRTTRLWNGLRIAFLGTLVLSYGVVLFQPWLADASAYRWWLGLLALGAFGVSLQYLIKRTEGSDRPASVLLRPDRLVVRRRKDADELTYFLAQAHSLAVTLHNPPNLQNKAFANASPQRLFRVGLRRLAENVVVRDPGRATLTLHTLQGGHNVFPLLMPQWKQWNGLKAYLKYWHQRGLPVQVATKQAAEESA